MTPSLLTPLEAAAHLSISPKQLRALVRAGRIRYISVGLGAVRETRRFSRDDLEEFLEKSRCRSTNVPARKPIRSTSASVVSDFQAQLDARRAARRNGSKRTTVPA